MKILFSWIWIRNIVSMNSQIILKKIISQFYPFTHRKSLETMANPVAKGMPISQSVVSKYHSPVKAAKNS